ncbi:MAG TPA: hypothetical protein VFU80_08810, partial [Sphingomicrobium sp.]|nr:hypothetical protein [Sphingomicrobium sp.]
RRFDDASAEIAEALRLGPDSWEVNKEAGRCAMFRRDIFGATERYEKAVEVMESDFHAWGILLTCYRAQDDAEKVQHAAKMMVSEAEKALQQDPSNGAALGIIAGGHAALGQIERAHEWIERAMLIDPDNLKMRYNFACVLASHLDKKDAALNLLERTFAIAGDLLVRAADTDPDLDSLRGHPRFEKILTGAKARLGIKETTVAVTDSSSAA